MRLPPMILSFLVVAVAGHSEEPPPKKDLPVDPPVVRSVSFSPDGTLLVASAMPKDRGGLVRVWDVVNKKLVSRYDQGGESPIAHFSPDGKNVVVANGRKLLTILDPKTGQKTGEIGPLSAEATAMQSAGPGRWVVRGKDGSFFLWDEKANKAVHDFGIGKQVWGWGVSPGGKWFFLNREGTDRLWDLTTGQEVEGIFKPQSGRANVPTFLAENRLLLGSNSGSHRLIELPSGKEILRFKNEGGTEAIAYSAATELLACRYYSSNTVSITPLTFRAPTTDETTRVARLLKECDSDDYATREKAATALVELGSAIEPLLQKAMADGPSAEVRMRARVARETILNKPKFQLNGHREEVRPMTFAPDGKLFATGAADGLVILWSPTTGKEVARLSVSE